MYKNLKSAMITNGYISSYFPVTRGIRQGDCLSALLYIIQAEPLAMYLRKENAVKGMHIRDSDGNIHKLNCADYVDDSMKFCLDTADVEQCLDIIKDYGKASGSTLNMDKTVGLTNDETLVRQNQSSVHISTGPEKCLGINIGKNRNIDLYWKNIVERIDKKFNMWKLRNLSIIGKIDIVKSVGLSIALY